ncbi:zf-met domain-containing protein [Cephalotus follicularis]|uniref:Zf-met domain-containing protein n=1 Tax=Cephalotus follicularis TaxID=3775 RepID=A0A1Q3D4T7_CEPFO|nr:zf-met domain-containing protein [Cephalotus follicularis]
MIKRRFYRQDHGDRDNDDASDSSSSSSDSEVEAEATEGESCPPSSGYESEDSSANEIDADSPGLTNEDDTEIGDDREMVTERNLSSKDGAKVLNAQSNMMPDKELMSTNVPACILKCKSVFKCRMCPRIVCLTEETMRAHIKSKRHVRSEKLCKEGRLKTMINSDGEIENQETAMEMHARIVALGQDVKKKNDKNKGRQRQRKRSKREVVGDDSSKKARESTKAPAKKRRKRGN